MLGHGAGGSRAVKSPSPGRVCSTGVGWTDDISIEIGEHPFGTGLGAIDGDDAEVLGPDLLDPGMDRARGLGDRGGTAGPARARRDVMAMWTPPEFGEESSRNPQDSPDAPERRFFSQLKATYQGSGAEERKGVKSRKPESAPDPFVPPIRGPGRSRRRPTRTSTESGLGCPPELLLRFPAARPRPIHPHPAGAGLARASEPGSRAPILGQTASQTADFGRRTIEPVVPPEPAAGLPTVARVMSVGFRTAEASRTGRRGGRYGRTRRVRPQTGR